MRFGMGIVVLPVALNRLQGVELALWMLFSTLISLALLSDSGLSPTLLRAAAYFRNGVHELPLSFNSQYGEKRPSSGSGEPNWGGIHTLIATTGRIYGFIALGTLLILGIGGSASVWNLMELSDHNSSFWLAFSVLVVWSCIQVQIARWYGILQGLGRVAQARRIDAVFTVLRIVFFSMVLWFGGGLLGYACVGLVIVVLNLFFMRRAVMASIPRREPGVMYTYDHQLFLRIWPATWRLGLINMGAFLIYYGSSLIIAQLRDPELIASFLFVIRVVLIMRQIANAPLVTYLPAVIGSLARSDILTYRALTARIVVMSISLFLLESVVLLLIGNRALELLGAETRLISTSLLLVFLFAYLMELHLSIHTALYISTNHVPFVLPALISGTLIVILGYLLLGSYGLWGIILVQIAVQSLCNYWYPVYLSLGVSNWSFGKYIRALGSESLALSARLVNSRSKGALS